MLSVGLGKGSGPKLRSSYDKGAAAFAELSMAPPDKPNTSEDSNRIDNASIKGRNDSNSSRDNNNGLGPKHAAAAAVPHQEQVGGGPVVVDAAEAEAINPHNGGHHVLGGEDRKSSLDNDNDKAGHSFRVECEEERFTLHAKLLSLLRNLSSEGLLLPSSGVWQNFPGTDY